MDPDEIIARLQSGEFRAAPAASAAATAMVYLGEYPGPDRGPAMHADSLSGPSDRGPAAHYEPRPPIWAEQRTKPTGPREADVDTAAFQINGWSEARIKRWEKILLDNGIIEPGQYNWETLKKAWADAVAGAAELYAAGKKVTPEQYVELYVGSKGIGGVGGGGGPTTTTRTDITRFDDLDAKATAEDAYGALLGRAPTRREREALHAAMNAYAKQHPAISTTTTDADGNSTTVSKGGVGNIGQIVEDRVKAKPEYAAYQAATTITNWVEQALGATTDY